MTIKEIQQKYFNKVSPLDLEIIISYALQKPREFVLTHPEFNLSFLKKLKIKNLIRRRMRHEPISQIIGTKEFFGLDFKVNKHTLTPRPETELIVEDALQEIESGPISSVVDLGTGSGNIIISIAKNTSPQKKIYFFATDISRKALRVAKINAQKNNLRNSITFIEGSLLKILIKDYEEIFHQSDPLIITANLPYLSKDIYNSSPKDVRDYEPKSALYSPEEGLGHYKELLEQIQSLPKVTNFKQKIILYLEISPEQKDIAKKMIQQKIPGAQIEFKKDLAQKWRIAKVKI